jgi:hypothetical protein
MREAFFLLDLPNGPTGPLRSGLLATEVGIALCRTFGGFTATEALGCWFPVSEVPAAARTEPVCDPSVKFTVAIGAGDWPLFRKLALELAAGQETVYLCGPTGDVFILPVLLPAQLAANGE